MFCDVLAACLAIGRARVVTPDEEAAAAALDSGAESIADPGGGQGAAVQAGLEGVEVDGILIVNADVPCVVPQDLRSLLAATPAGSFALVEALDGTTNALSLPAPEAFAPLYGPDSASRFRAHAEQLGLQAVSAIVVGAVVIRHAALTPRPAPGRPPARRADRTGPAEPATS